MNCVEAGVRIFEEEKTFFSGPFPNFMLFLCILSIVKDFIEIFSSAHWAQMRSGRVSSP